MDWILEPDPCERVPDLAALEPSRVGGVAHGLAQNAQVFARVAKPLKTG